MEPFPLSAAAGDPGAPADRSLSRARFRATFMLCAFAAVVSAPGAGLWLGDCLTGSTTSSFTLSGTMNAPMIGFQWMMISLSLGLLLGLSFLLARWRAAAARWKRERASRLFSWTGLPLFVAGSALTIAAVYEALCSMTSFGFGFPEKASDFLLAVCLPGLRLYRLITPPPGVMDMGYAFLGLAFVFVVYSLVLGVLADIVYCRLVRLLA